jgi:flavin-dependent dehydrogenase
VSSAVSRAIGNTLKDGVLAVSVRAYYRGVASDGARMKVYFDRDYFPGYGWLFVDDDGFANVGLGCVYDRNFPMMDNLGGCFRRFLDTDLAHGAKAHDVGRSRADRPAIDPNPSLAIVLLIGDAAIKPRSMAAGYKAMEITAPPGLRSAVCRRFLSAMQRYETLWAKLRSRRRTAEIFMSIARIGPQDFSCSHKQIGKQFESRFRDFAGGV